MAEETNASPPWGALPVEQYLIVPKQTSVPNPTPFPSARLNNNHPSQRNWDPSSPLSNPSQQTRALVRGFLALDTVPEEWDTTNAWPLHPIPRVPTADQVRTVLAPWRPARWRDAAAHLWRRRGDHAVWLRTHYGAGSDGQFYAWRDADEDWNPEFEEEEVPWLVFDDREVFDVGEEWWRALEVVPELVRPGYVDDEIPAVRERLRERIRERVAAGEDEEEVAVWEAEYGEYGQDLQVRSVTSYLVVVDANAWETECFRLLFLDSKGNIVRHSIIEAQYSFEVPGFWLGRKFRDISWWVFDSECDARVTLGGAYRARGEQGQALYGLGL